MKPLCPDGVVESAVQYPTDATLYQCPDSSDGTPSYMCSGEMMDEVEDADGNISYQGTGTFLDYFFASPMEIKAVAAGSTFMNCKVSGLIKDSQDIVLNFLVNSEIDEHLLGTPHDVCLHMQEAQAQSGGSGGFLISSTLFAYNNDGYAYNVGPPDGVVPDPSLHYGTAMGEFCAPGPLTHIIMCVTPCSNDGLVPTPAPPAPPRTPVPTSPPVDMPIAPQPCPVEGRGALTANYTADADLGDGGTKFVKCPMGSKCVLPGYDQEFLQSTDMMSDPVQEIWFDDGSEFTMNCTFGDVAIDVKITMLNNSNFEFEILTPGYFITAGIMKSGMENMLFSWPLCGTTAKCCTGTDCEYCDLGEHPDSVWAGEPYVYGGRTSVSVGTPYVYSGNKYKQQAMSHVTLCLNTTDYVCPGMDC